MPLAVKYLIAALFGIAVGSYAIPPVAVGVIYLVFGVICIFYSLAGNTSKLFTFLPYLVYTEIYVRAYDFFILYLFAQFTMVACFALLLLRQGTLIKIKSHSFIFIFLYAAIELIDIFRTAEPDFARVAITNSVLLFLISFWSSTATISLPLINKLLDHLKLAGIYLTGIIAAAHLRGNIHYVLHSSIGTTNGLAPVQISAYLGVAAVLFFLSIVNEHERKHVVINLICFALSTIFMLLSFSRGGLYFLGAIIVMYFAFNWRKAANYSMMLLLVPAGFAIYNYVLNTTGGLIAERYEQQGSSGRDVLVEIGFEIFQSAPVAGIGTGNFSKEIVKRNLYAVESGAHNEFVRAAAEHGILGIITYWGFYVSLFFELAMRRGVARQYSLYFFVLFCLIIVHNGMKISIQPLLLIFVVGVPVITKITNKKDVQTVYKQP
jgi:O-antigen ligase